MLNYCYEKNTDANYYFINEAWLSSLTEKIPGVNYICSNILPGKQCIKVQIELLLR